MKTKIILMFILILTFSLSTIAQDTIAAWTFPTGTAADANPNHHNAANVAVVLSTGGGTSTIDFTKNGHTSKAAQTTGWDGGANTKYWQIEINSTNYNNITLYSKQTGGGANPGPRDWKVQYKISSSGVWTDIPGTSMTCANNWTSAVLSNVSLPSSCHNQTSLFIRWLMTTDTSLSSPNLVLANGTSKIDDIFVLGTIITSINENHSANCTLYPNPNAGSFNISFSKPVRELYIYNLHGKVIYQCALSDMKHYIDLSNLLAGIYLLGYYIDGTSELITQKFIIQ